MPFLTTIGSASVISFGLSFISQDPIISTVGKYFSSGEQWTEVANWSLNENNTGTATQIPNGATDAVLHKDCIADVDTWVEPNSIDIMSYSLTFTSAIGASVGCNIQGTGNLDFVGANYSPNAVLYGTYFSAGINQSWSTLENWYFTYTGGSNVPATAFPRFTTAVTLLTDCDANIDAWIAPLSIDIGSHTITFTSVANKYLTCDVTGTTGEVILDGVQLAP
jgi:hypothetical protein